MCIVKCYISKLYDNQVLLKTALKVSIQIFFVSIQPYQTNDGKI
jgi:hypothetical protein